MYYASFGMLAIVIHFIINFDMIRGRRKDEDGRADIWKRYQMFLLGIVIYYLSDILWGVLYASKIIPLTYADTVLYFVSMVLSVFLWMRFTVAYLERENLVSKLLTCVGWSLMLLEALVLIINFFIPIVFEFKPDGEYVPGKIRYLTLALQFVLYVLLGVYALVVASRSKKKSADWRHHMAVGVSGIVMALFIVLQAQYPLLPFYAIGCLLANCLIHTFVELDEKEARAHELGSAKKMAYRDPLTGVRNANAYKEVKFSLEERIRDKILSELGVIVFDLNNLKYVNDNYGHEMGDKYIQRSCKLICTTFKHSPVFRIGGDEFVTLLEGDDYENRDALFAQFNSIIEENLRKGGPVVAGGMSVYHSGIDDSYDTVFKQADAKMYARKKELKGTD